MNAWIAAARLRTLPAAAVPVAVVNWISPLLNAAATIDGLIMMNSVWIPSCVKKPFFQATIIGK